MNAADFLPAAPDTTHQELLSFELAGDTYGIDIRQVREVRSFEAPTRLANAEAAHLGVTNLRGEIVPVIDLRTRLGLAAPFGETTITVVLQLDGQCIGIVVDSVSDVVDLAPNRIRPLPPAGTSLATAHISGFVDVADSSGHARLLTLLDMGRLLHGMTACAGAAH